jgi:hypothetical protein
MNTYDVSVKGKKIFTEISCENLENTLKELKALVWVSGGSNDDIIVEKSLKNKC